LTLRKIISNQLVKISNVTAQQLCRIIPALIVMLCAGQVAVAQDHSAIVVQVLSLEELNFNDESIFELKSRNLLNEALSELQDKAFLNSYLAFSIDSIYSEKDTIRVRVNRGKRYIVDEIEIIFPPSDSLKDYKVKSDLITSKIQLSNINEVQKNLLSHFENNGYPFVGIRIIDFNTEAKGTKVLMELDQGPLYRMDSLIIKSDSEISSRIIYNRIGMKKGEVYNEQKIREIESRVNEIGFISLKESPQVVFTKDKAILYLFLNKKSSNRLNGLLGFLPNDQGKVEFTGNIELQLANALGADEFLDFNWRKLQEQTQDLKINFAYPYIANLNLGFEQKLSIYKHDTTYTEVKLKSSLQYLFSRYKFLSVFVQSRIHNSLLNSIEGESNPESNTLQYGLGGGWSNLDYRFNPRRGVDGEISIAIGDKKLQGINTEELMVLNQATQLTMEGRVAHYFPLKKRSVLKSHLTFSHIESDFIIENELYRLGGVKSIRGFDEEAFNASSYGILGLEYRYLTDRNSYFSGFVDYAYFEKNKVEFESRTSGQAIGFGLGAAFETKAGIFSLSYALGSLNDAPFLVRSGKVHFGFNAIF
jgi:outer membrane protein assembly factor BamA